MFGKNGVQKLLQKRLAVFFQVCIALINSFFFVDLAIAAENLVEDSLHICNLLCTEVFGKPTVSFHYQGITLKLQFGELQ